MNLIRFVVRSQTECCNQDFTEEGAKEVLVARLKLGDRSVKWREFLDLQHLGFLSVGQGEDRMYLPRDTDVAMIQLLYVCHGVFARSNVRVEAGPTARR